MLTSIHSWAREIYRTGFDEFAVGPNQLAGQHGWRATVGSDGVQGVDENILPGLGKSGFVGFSRPSAGFVSVFHSVTALLAGLEPFVIEFNTLIGIEDSTNDFRDNFYITVYNANNHLLGAINFDNTQANLGIWRLDGATAVATGASFVTGNLHELYLRIDLVENIWTATLDGLPLFSGANFNATGHDRQLGSFAAEWELMDSQNPGNNWMLFDEWSVSVPDGAFLVKADPIPDPDPVDRVDLVKSIAIGGTSTLGNDMFHLHWPSEANVDYQIEWSDDLSRWHTDLPSSAIRGVNQSQMAFADPIVKAHRYYRLVAIRREELTQPRGEAPINEPALERP